MDVPGRAYLHQLRTVTGCSLEELPGAMDDKDRLRETRKSMQSVQIDDDCDL